MSLKLLIVDDNADVLKVLKELLQSLGYEVLAMSDSRDAAARIDRQKFDAIFVDALMPEMNGFELARHIRNSASNGSAPIIMLTGYDDVDTMRAGFKAGITFFLGKPPELAKLSGLLRCLYGAMLREKRSYVRLPLRTVVSCEKDGHRFTSMSANISEGGILLDYSGGLVPGNSVTLQFSLPQSSGILTTRALVIRKELPDRIGLHFTELDQTERRAIQDYIAGRVKE